MAIAIQDDFASAYYNRGNAMANLGQLRKAVESYKRVLELEGGDAATYYNIALAFEELKEHEAAIRYFKLALSEEETVRGGVVRARLLLRRPGAVQRGSHLTLTGP